MLFPYVPGFFPKAEHVKNPNSDYVKRAVCPLHQTPKCRGYKVGCLPAFKIKVLRKSPVFEKAEQSGPVEAESKHSEAALQTLLQKLCEYQIQIPAEKEKKKKYWVSKHIWHNTEILFQRKFVFLNLAFKTIYPIIILIFVYLKNCNKSCCI